MCSSSLEFPPNFKLLHALLVRYLLVISNIRRWKLNSSVFLKWFSSSSNATWTTQLLKSQILESSSLILSFLIYPHLIYCQILASIFKYIQNLTNFLMTTATTLVQSSVNNSQGWNNYCGTVSWNTNHLVPIYFVCHSLI
jgi:hypothetical protein